ncbi:hypothetical protein P4C99_08675 [Pontiellaceae bacterium B1224]|nr:hypothetical protein [Pontiellaceae bacterium B1224]
MKTFCGSGGTEMDGDAANADKLMDRQKQLTKNWPIDDDAEILFVWLLVIWPDPIITVYALIRRIGTQGVYTMFIHI